MNNASEMPGNGRGGRADSASAARALRVSEPSASGPLSNGRHADTWQAWLLRRLYAMRVPLLGFAHLTVFAAVYWFAFQLRFEFVMRSGEWRLFWASLPCVLGVKFVLFYMAGQYHGWWRYVTFADLLALLRAALLSLVILSAIDYFVDWAGVRQIPRSVMILDFMLTVVVLGSLRASWRMFREQFAPILGKSGARGALVVGVDHATAMLAYHIQSHYELPFRIRGFLTIEPDPARYGSRLGQIPIVGSLDDVAASATAANASDIVVTAGVLSGTQMRKLMDDCRDAELALKILRPLEDHINGDLRIPTRDIEISDLLRRDPVQLDSESIGELIAGKRILVTGAGGSIGSEICRQLLKFEPRALVLLGRGENRIFVVERELRAVSGGTELSAVIGDVTDRRRMRQVFEEFRPEVVFHAAAHKHVPLMEANVGEAIRNNVFGTKCIAELAHEFSAEACVLISTDKAVHPTSVMGVSKQLAERYVYAMSQESSTRFMVVRFGNVLGSNGSVVPIFQEQIRRGGPITITDPRMTRFFMTIPEASQLVLQAAAMGQGGEIFVLEMGEPVKIVDLARDLVRLSGLPEHAIEITFTGMRPGEKLYEELYFDEEQTLPTAHPKLRAAYHRPYSLDEVHQALRDLEPLVNGPSDDLRAMLKSIVPEFTCPLAAALPPTNGSDVSDAAHLLPDAARLIPKSPSGVPQPASADT
ncbi:MAG: polysaccharide biosynthesis protein [Planctomycetota bacterium]